MPTTGRTSPGSCAPSTWPSCVRSKASGKGLCTVTALPLNTATPEPAKVLIVDDDAEVRSVLEAGLAGFACSSVACGSAGEAQQEIRKDRFAVVLSDIRMPDMSGLELLHHIRDYDTDISVIMITGVNEIETALEAMRLGACDYITKP
ncbi:MAG: response regulator, partial [Acidobacteria bacterium]|nr:response regulator [Acidobacteriota bacterium]